jgi:DNA-directed RNA polymerase beta subunit
MSQNKALKRSIQKKKTADPTGSTEETFEIEQVEMLKKPFESDNKPKTMDKKPMDKKPMDKKPVDKKPGVLEDDIAVPIEEEQPEEMNKKSHAEMVADIEKVFKSGKMNENVSENDFNYYEDTFKVIDTILHQHNSRELVNHQHASYKQFIEKDIGDIVKQFNTRKLYFQYDTHANKYKLELHIDFLNYNLGRPTIHENDGSFKVMRPDIAKLRNLAYSSPLTLNIKLTRVLRSSSNPEVKIKPDGSEEVIETYDQEDIKEEIFNNINFGRIPIMVMGSNCVLNKNDGTTLEMNGECPYDLGGYFIIGGNEKVIISQERIAENEPFVFNNQKKLKGKD